MEIKNIILTPNPYRDHEFQTVQKAAEILRSSGANIHFCLPFDVDRSFRLPKSIRFTRFDKALADADLIVCFGGDGTILHMSKAAAKYGIPILGVNIGTMGFIAELEVTELELLRDLVHGRYTLDRRGMLDVTVYRDRTILYHETGLNDAAITKAAAAKMISIRVTCDGRSAMEFSGDGVVLATPTGSTGYSYSAGGPIVEPHSKNLLMTPLCPRETGSHPMVISDQRTVAAEITGSSHTNAYLSVDGGHAFKLNAGDQIVVRKSDKETSLVRLKERSFYDIVKEKLSAGK